VAESAGRTLIAAPKRYDPVIDIQTFYPHYNTKFKPDESNADNVVTRELEEQMGIRYTYTSEITSAEAADQVWPLILASGDIPEYLPCFISGDVYQKLLDGDQLADITDIWEQTASDTMKAKMEYPSSLMWRTVSRDDRIYGLPFANAVGANDMTMWIRQDWLDQLGLQAPTTFDEMTALGKAFMDAGLAKIGIAFANDANFGTVTYLGSMDPIYGAFGVMPTYWRTGADGKLAYGSIQPGVKDALKLISEWYASGVIDREFFTVPPGGAEGVESKIISGESGIMFGPWWFATYAPQLLNEIDPAAKLAYYELPAGPNGKRGRSATSVLYGVHGFRKDIDPVKIEAVINHMNWMVDRLVQSLETRDYLLYEGYDFMVDGDAVKQGDFGTQRYAVGGWWPAYQYPTQFVDLIAQLDQLKERDPASLAAVERLQISNSDLISAYAAYQQVADTSNYAIPNEFVGQPTATMTSEGSNLRTLEVEAFARIITGQAPLDAFDEFVAAWKAQGGDAITEEVNAAS
jgi:putative aldouronate transport system substrate-binding protein